MLQSIKRTCAGARLTLAAAVLAFGGLAGEARPVFAQVGAQVGAQGEAPETGVARSKPRECFLVGLDRPAECHDIEVPLDWSDPDGETITLFAAVLPSRTANPDLEPLFILAGGPGQAASELGPIIGRAFEKVRRERDLILLDQRGAGRSAKLDCDLSEVDPFEQLDDAATLAFAQDCADALPYDLRHFQTEDAARDLDHVRAALGYDKVMLWGGSYGTRIGLHFMKRYPERVTAAVLDGVAPPTSSLFETSPGYSQAALDKLIEDCAADEDCAATFPDFGTTVSALLARFEEADRQISVYELDGVSRREITFTYDMLAESLRNILYIPSRTALLPFAITQFEQQNNPDVLMAMLYDGLAFAREGMARGMTLAVLCAEDIAATSQSQVEAAAGDSFHGDLFYRLFATSCPAFPTKPTPADYTEPVSVDIPTLVLSGALDPITPPAAGEEALETLPNGQHIVAPGAGHGVTTTGCAPDLIAQFLKDPSAEVDGECLETTSRPPFVTSGAGPRP